MKKIQVLTIILLIAFSSSSCSVIEKLFLREDGSGTYFMTLDLSIVGGLIKELSGTTDALYEELAPAKNLPDTLKKLELIPSDIADFKTVIDKEELTVSYSLAFSDINSLNELFHNVLNIDSLISNNVKLEKKTKQSDMFTKSKRIFKRNEFDPIGSGILEDDNTDRNESDVFSKKNLFEGAFHEFILEFEGTIKKVSNKDYELITPNSLAIKRYYLNKEDEKKRVEVRVKIK